MQKSTMAAIFISISFLLFFWYLVASSFFDTSLATQKKFATDGCTLFIDSNWGKCCIDHDKSYWTGGTSQQRKEADIKFRECVYEASGKKALSQVMYGSVRVGGVPFVATPWRWGFGWEFGRGYR